MAEHGRSNGRVVAVGEVEGHSIEVMEVHFSFGARYIWRAIKGGKIVHQDEYHHDGIAEAIDGAVQHFYPDTEEVEFKEPEPADFEALSALMYVGGMQEDITSMSEVVEMFTAFAHALDAIQQVKAKAENDLDAIEDVLASAPKADAVHIENLRSIAEIFQSQCDVLANITERNMQTLNTFITHFLKL